MSHNQARDPRKEQQWRRLIDEWQQSGLSVRAFCARYHLSEPSFYSWRRELHRRPAERPTFVPVRVVRTEVPVATGGVEIVLRSGRSLRVGPGFDAALLRQVLAALEEEPPC